MRDSMARLYVGNPSSPKVSLMNVEFDVLEEVRARVDGRPIDLGDRKQRLMVGVLILEDRVVSKERLTRLMWGQDERVQNPNGAIHSYAKGIRKAFGDALTGGRDLLQTRYGVGYRLVFERRHVDYFRFRDLANLAAARVVHDRVEAARLWRQALGEWGPNRAGLHGGHPLGEVVPEPIEQYRNSLQQEYRSALMGCLETELMYGRHNELIPELARLTEHDQAGRSDETLAQLLMLAYYRADQMPAVVEAHERLRRELDVLGVEPAKQTRDLYQQILRQDPALDLPKGPHMSCADITNTDISLDEQVDPVEPMQDRDPSASGPHDEPEPNSEGGVTPGIVNKFENVNAPGGYFGNVFNDRGDL
jgi:DNA-binding SARP family transcriptional activator